MLCLAEVSRYVLPSILALLFAFPSAIFTVLLGVALLYWLFVIIGAAHIDLLGDGAADGALDGLDAGHGDIGGHGHVDVGDAGGDAGDAGDGGDAHAGDGAHGILGALKLRSAPATVVLSILILFSWLFSVFGMQASAAWLPAGVQGIARFALLVLSPMLALPLTSICVRPLAKVFTTKNAVLHADLVGKVCTVRTGTVTDRFGEGLLEDGGAGVVVRIRVDAGEPVKRGDRVVIVDYDDKKQEFTVAPMEALDGDPESDAAARFRSLK